MYMNDKYFHKFVDIERCVCYEVDIMYLVK